MWIHFSQSYLLKLCRNVTETPFLPSTSSYSVDNSGINAFMQSKTFLITVLNYILRLRKALHKQSPSNIFFRGLTSSQIVVNVNPKFMTS